MNPTQDWCELSRRASCPWTLPSPMNHDFDSCFAEVPTPQLFLSLGQNAPSRASKISNTKSLHKGWWHLWNFFKHWRSKIISFLMHPIPAMSACFSVLRYAGSWISCTKVPVEHLLNNKAGCMPNAPGWHDFLGPAKFGNKEGQNCGGHCVFSPIFADYFTIVLLRTAHYMLYSKALSSEFVWQLSACHP